MISPLQGVWVEGGLSVCAEAVPVRLKDKLDTVRVIATLERVLEQPLVREECREA